jgi:hypothetical protein
MAKTELTAADLRLRVDHLNAQIVDQLTLAVSKEDLDGLAGYLVDLSNLLPNGALSVSTSEMIYNLKIGELVESQAYSGLSATDKKMVFQGKAAKEIALMTYSDNLNKSLSKRIEAIRSIMSLAKVELEQIHN